MPRRLGACRSPIDRCQPFVIYHERLVFVLGEREVFGYELDFQGFLRALESGLSFGLFVELRGVVFQRLAFVGIVRVAADFPEAGLHGFGGKAGFDNFDDLGGL